ncbi:MFS transporter [Variovorax sp. J22R133]|uniref:MFS transporter n=1 Tax=Variovorax brevis TaxID=3053503 RepID=UPI0025770B46|nr:MFS transporter [Variovorax sp. J22R133]MDM0114372.1 MFS transporter [Variovorax sp. J22R133]
MPIPSRSIPLPASLQIALPLVILAFGHTLSNLIRTLPAIATDVMSADIGTTTGYLGVLTGAYHLFFALGQIPAGVMLDRLGVRTVSLSLFAITALGATAGAFAHDAFSFFMAQALLGIGCCGMLLCPFTLAAKTLPPARFALWSGLILSIGNCGMLLSATPMAWLIEHHGWRASFWFSAALAVGIGALVALVVPGMKRTATAPSLELKAEFREVLRMTASMPMRGPVLLAFTSLAAALAVRGVWGGPWFMEIKGLSRIEAGNALIPLTLALAIGPLVAGAIDRLTGARRALLAGSHLVAGLLLLVVVASVPGGWLQGGFLGSASFDAWIFFAFGCCISTQPLLFAMGQASTPKEKSGKALAALNLMFFCGTAFHQLASGWIASTFGLVTVFFYFAMALAGSTLLFLHYTRRPRREGRVPG